MLMVKYHGVNANIFLTSSLCFIHVHQSHRMCVYISIISFILYREIDVLFR